MILYQVDEVTMEENLLSEYPEVDSSAELNQMYGFDFDPTMALTTQHAGLSIFFTDTLMRDESVGVLP